MNRDHDFDAPVITQQAIPAVVKWFNPVKGFGFVQPDDGSPDAFLHISVVEQSGHRDLPEGTRLVCDVAEGRKGPQVAAIVRIDEIPASAPRASAGHHAGGEATSLEGTVKFFNSEKGFGFVVPDDGSKDVFVSARTLERAGLHMLESDQRVRLSIRMGQKGPMAESVEIV